MVGEHFKRIKISTLIIWMGGNCEPNIELYREDMCEWFLLICFTHTDKFFNTDKILTITCLKINVWQNIRFWRSLVLQNIYNLHPFFIFASPQQKEDNYSIAFIQLYNFIRPLYLAYSYEETKGSQHKVLASALKDTSFHLNATVWRVKREVNYLQIWSSPLFFLLRLYFTYGRVKRLSHDI